MWRIGAVAAGLIGTALPADAATSMFWDSDSAYYIHEPAAPPVRPKRRAKAYPKTNPKTEAKADKSQKEAAKPQGPLVIAVSIDQQTMKIYDANGLFAETPVSTGMRGHSTPMGVFSVIQKNKYHRSNLYSGAPMPYMQRITWSGVAMHAGVLPGYPASHGCIRMPMSFAMKMWGWTRMGARVVITPGELTPASFAHPLLVTQKPAPTSSAALIPSDASDAKLSRLAAASADDGLQLRPALIPHADAGRVGVSTAPLGRDQVRTADAGSTAGGAAIASDAGSLPAAADTKPAADTKAAQTSPAAPSDDKSADKVAPAADKDASKPAPTASAPETKTDDKSDGKTDAKSEPAKPEGPKADATPKRSGQIAAFVSRKDSRLYVRQNFAPLFDVPVEITGADRPLGTHIFTARLDKDNPTAVSWSVVSLPLAARRAEARDDEDRTTRRRKSVGAVDVSPQPQPSSAAEALDRLNIPADAMAKITEALSTGGSLIVSDQGIAAGETGEGTDFIIRLR